MAQSKAPSPRALAAYEAARAAGASVEEASALLAPKPRVRRERETSDYLKDLTRLIRAAGRRVADADGPELAQLLALMPVMEEAAAMGVKGQLERGSWQYVADSLGVKRQSAFEKWAPKVKALGGTSHG
jgi:uncharacterized protein HemY